MATTEANVDGSLTAVFGSNEYVYFGGVGAVAVLIMVILCTVACYILCRKESGVSKRKQKGIAANRRLVNVASRPGNRRPARVEELEMAQIYHEDDERKKNDYPDGVPADDDVQGGASLGVVIPAPKALARNSRLGLTETPRATGPASLVHAGGSQAVDHTKMPLVADVETPTSATKEVALDDQTRNMVAELDQAAPSPAGGSLRVKTKTPAPAPKSASTETPKALRQFMAEEGELNKRNAELVAEVLAEDELQASPPMKRSEATVLAEEEASRVEQERSQLVADALVEDEEEMDDFDEAAQALARVRAANIQLKAQKAPSVVPGKKSGASTDNDEDNDSAEEANETIDA